MFKQFIWIFILLLFSCESKSQKKENDSIPQATKTIQIPEKQMMELKEFLKKNTKYNSKIGIFINFRIPSSQFRFFVVDLVNSKILEKGLVAHGSGSVINNSSGLKFSNIENSHQSSLGKYAIASSYVGGFGKSYRLSGLDSSNNLALKRTIVLHPYYCVPDQESESPICLSLGCPMLSPNFFKVVSSYIDDSEKRIIIYAFY